MSKLRNLFTHSSSGWWTLPEDSVKSSTLEADKIFGNLPSLMKRSWHFLTSADQHATPTYYWMIGIVLAIITFLEVILFGVDLLRNWFVAIMIGLSGVKFALVAAFFMHLRFENKVYTQFFLVCMTIGFAIFIAFLLLKAFQGSGL